ncbi:MAG TPA: (d)CMP kinase [candidate division Zixibacteria bacterium]|nr:(d)CMP kinase [candidate division Zixibacteria bacterium]
MAPGDPQPRRFIIAIDGPSGAGKSTLAKRVAKELGFTYLDTGAMYRAIALKVLKEGIDLRSLERLQDLVNRTSIDLVDCDGSPRVYLDGVDVTDAIRDPEVSQMASKASALKVVRDKMLELQRAIGARGGLVAEGRDIGTVVFPEAEVKIYLDASVGERARRRFLELRAAGRDVDFESTVREIEERDRRDSERDLAPLRRAQDAVAIDSSTLSAAEVAERVMRIVRAKLSEN